MADLVKIEREKGGHLCNLLPVGERGAENREGEEGEKKGKKGGGHCVFVVCLLKKEVGI